MAEAEPRKPGQPFTLGGVARYGRAQAGRVLGVGFLFGLICGGAIALLLGARWAPVIGTAIGNLPETSAIHGGVLVWPEGKGRLLAASPYLSVAVAEGAEEGASVDFAVEFGARELRVRSLLGGAALPYPRGWSIGLNRGTLLPLWGAWEQLLPAAMALAGAVALLGAWCGLAVPYTVATRFFALVLGKPLGFGGAWKLCVAAQWPGAVLLSFVLLLYTLGQATLVLVTAAFAAHFALTGFYLVFTPVCLPKPADNPFSGGREKARVGKNPFGEG